MSFEQAVFGHRATPRDIYLATLWLCSTALVFTGLSLIALNRDVGLLTFVFLLFAVPAFFLLRPDLKAPITGVVFKKFELLMLGVIALATWIFISALWFRSIWAVIVTLLLLGAIALVLRLPGYAGKGVSPEEDERLRKLDAFSSADAFNITFVFITLICLLGFFRIVVMDFRQAFTIIVFLIIFLKSVSLSYYNRKGDVQ
jgi:hypothetical protein